MHTSMFLCLPESISNGKAELVGIVLIAIRCQVCDKIIAMRLV